MGNDVVQNPINALDTWFQSSFPIQGTTVRKWQKLNWMRYFNPRSLYRERRWENGRNWIGCDISIHVPYTGNDDADIAALNNGLISIHVPYTGNDADFWAHSSHGWDFNPRSLYRERHFICRLLPEPTIFQSTFPIQGTTSRADRGGADPALFQSTFPIQGTTHTGHHNHYCLCISIHVPYTGNDRDHFDSAVTQ